MLATTKSARCAALVTSAMWPLCRLPMVGTKAMRLPSPRARATAARSSRTVFTVFMQKTRVRRQESRCFDLRNVGAQSRLDGRLPNHEVLHELGYATGDRQPEHVVQHQHLAIGGVAGTDPDYRDIYRLGDFFGQLAGHAFEQQHRRASLLQCNRIGAHLPRLVFIAALDFVATEDIDRLWGQAQVRAHRDAPLGQQPNRIGQPQRALDLDHVGTGLHQHGAVGHGLFEGGVGHEWQVGENQCIGVTAFDGGHMVGHLGGGHRQRAVVTLQHHAEGIAHQQHFDTGLIAGVGESCVIAGQHGDFLTFLLETLQRGQGNSWHEKVLIRRS